jgi:hypothetical protein
MRRIRPINRERLSVNCFTAGLIVKEESRHHRAGTRTLRDLPKYPGKFTHSHFSLAAPAATGCTASGSTRGTSTAPELPAAKHNLLPLRASAAMAMSANCKSPLSAAAFCSLGESLTRPCLAGSIAGWVRWTPAFWYSKRRSAMILALSTFSLTFAAVGCGGGGCRRPRSACSSKVVIAL